jgi:RND superfamily putative drug exporter
MKSPAATVRIARWSAEHPWRAIVGWVVFVAVCIAVGSMAGTKEPADSDFRLGESGRASAIIADGNFRDPVVENVLITAKAGALDTGAAKAAAADVAQRMRALPEVAKVADPVPSQNGKALMVPVTMKAEKDSAKQDIQPLLDAAAAAQAAHPALRVEQTGGVSLNKGINNRVGDDLVFAEKLTLPATIIILLVAFGAIIAAGVPVLLAISAVGAAIGLAALTSHVIPNVDTVNNVILLIGMAVGVDYSLFYLKREREERARAGGQLDHVTAVQLAAATSGRAIVVSGFAVIVSMAGLYLAGDVVFSSLATGSVIVVAVAMIGSLTVLPALLAKLGRRVDRPRVPLLGRLSNRQGPPRLWPALLQPALRRPVATLLLATAAMLALAMPALNLKLTSPNIDTLPRTIPAVQAYERLAESFPSEGATHVVAVRTDAAHTGQVTAALNELARDAGTDPLFAVKDGAAKIKTSADGRITTLRVATPFRGNSEEARQSLERLKNQLVPSTVGRLPGVEYAVGGGVAQTVDDVAHQSEKLPWVVGFVLLLTFVMMAFAFRSVVVALTSILLNLLSAAGAFGVLVGVFQYQWAEKILDFHSTGAIISWIPLFVFVVLFGLSMDYHVFVVSRIKEAALRGVPTRKAVADGITGSAGVVTSAALVMVSVFACFVFTSMTEMKEMGLGLAVAVLLDAVVIRILILPALMTLLGKANWWPSRGVGRAQKAQQAAESRPLLSAHAG